MKSFMGLWSISMAVRMTDEAVAWKIFRSLGPWVCAQENNEKSYEQGYTKFLVGWKD